MKNRSVSAFLWIALVWLLNSSGVHAEEFAKGPDALEVFDIRDGMTYINHFSGHGG